MSNFAMRLKDSVVSLPMHQGLNNNQLQQSEISASSNSEEIENCNDRTTAFSLQEFQELRSSQEGGTWPAAQNVGVQNISNNVTVNHSNGRNNINNNLTASRLYQSSSAESLADYEGRNSVEDSSHELTPSEWSDWSEEGNLPTRCRGIVNPNYPGFQHLATSLLSDTDLTEDELEAYEVSKLTCNLNNNQYNNNTDENLIGGSVNHLQGQQSDRKFIYEKPKFNIHQEEATVEYIDLIREAKKLPLPDCSKIGNQPATAPNLRNGGQNDDSETNTDSESYSDLTPYTKLEEIDLLSSIGRDIGVDLEKYVQPVPDVVLMDSVEISPPCRVALGGDNNLIKDNLVPREDTNKLIDRDLPETPIDARKKEKMARNQARRRQQNHANQPQRRPDKRRADPDVGGPGGFDVYNIETAMPKIDLDAIESHLRAAREEERREDERVAEVVQAVAAGRNPDPKDRDKEDLVARFDRLVQGNPFVSPQRRNDREEIRRRLAMGPDAEDLRSERGRKPSLQSRLQSGMNLQICFMNDTSSDTESPVSEADTTPGPISSEIRAPVTRPQVLSLPPLRVDATAPVDEADFFARQARLQTEARMALAQAKEMAHMQMEVERQRLKQSPITEMVRSSLEKVGVQLGDERRRLSRVLLTELNVAQLQVVANDLHARIAALNEALVEGLLRRDDLHMEQDSMLVDVEDLTRYLGAKQESFKRQGIATRETSSMKSVERNQQSASLQVNKLLKPKLMNRGLVGLVRK
ncbi:schwannomin-interacting protein 1 homolog isoform X7 [Neodiprion lecontei]|uniref:Schwannomin-interacting protein 1 homolog isoform X7 n=2 Tax=Neodiprion TaxID=270857 RepID=A0ABM3FJ69_NEOLC|nr:schwannomin-interacting protein 1 homolog isoform X7 [Neodiprion fabricii]XP_046588078.1 schwannomin-interacting protein 1 homolog isoform X7 [Neodiprion lecontei]